MEEGFWDSLEGLVPAAVAADVVTPAAAAVALVLDMRAASQAQGNKRKKKNRCCRFSESETNASLIFFFAPSLSRSIEIRLLF